MGGDDGPEALLQGLTRVGGGSTTIPLVAPKQAKTLEPHKPSIRSLIPKQPKDVGDVRALQEILTDFQATGLEGFGVWRLMGWSGMAVGCYVLFHCMGSTLAQF